MKTKLDKLTAVTAAALALGFAGASLDAAAGGEKKVTTTTTQHSDGSMSTTMKTTERLNTLNGVTVVDTSGAQVGTVQSYTNANGEVVATVVNPSGSTSSLSLGAPDVLIADLPSSGSYAITMNGSKGSVSKTTTTTTTIK